MKGFLLLFTLSVFVFSCTQRKEALDARVNLALDLARQQSMAMAEILHDQPERLPKTIAADETLETCSSDWWVSGFFPGQLWYLYEYFGDEQLKNEAIAYSSRVADQQYTTDNHDVGFMIFCSYGNAYRITGNEEYLPIIENAARSLATRFSPLTGTIRSWDTSRWNQQWQYAVIIDNMMNLELLEWSAKKFDETLFSSIARQHANTTMKYHFRPDGSSYHVVSYDTISGKPHALHTAQGYSHSSAWARGQAWGLYGYTMMFRETGDSSYLEQAEAIADFIVNHPRLPEDKIPYWDFDAPDIPEALRDASAGAIICSALLELYQYVETEKSETYLKVAQQQLTTLCSPAYLAAAGENHHFILKHGVGHKPHGSEVDVPLTYADYYFVEALLRYQKIRNKK